MNAGRRTRRSAWRGAAAATVGASLFLLCSCRDAAEDGWSREGYGNEIVARGGEHAAIGREWLETALAALEDPTPVEPPYVEAGGFVGAEPAALVLSFAGSEGQVLEAGLIETPLAAASDPAERSGRIYLEVFAEERTEEGERRKRIGALRPGSSSLRLTLPQRATYLVLLQPELGTESQYRLTLELEAALPFPVRGMKSDAVQSFFGAPRDAGQRHHEGVDIFAPRSTPVVAVTDGRATPRQNRLGGNTVWLSTPGTSYYYAHLERVAVRPGQRVRAGDVLGYVGNTGNAVTTPPHLHFGVYRWGRGATDPLPLIVSRQFDVPPEPAAFAPRLVRTLGSPLNLRLGPSLEAPVVERLPGATIVRALAVSGDWLRIELPRAGSGWIHADYQTPVEADDSTGPTIARASAARSEPAVGSRGVVAGPGVGSRQVVAGSP
jgi:murein DD-endopeptidase MepM/ murein hydrolase activator NlpD